MRQATNDAGKMGDALSQVRAKGGAALKILNDFAGPLALASGAALTFALRCGKSLRNLEMIDKALASIEKRDFIRGQFKSLLGGLAAAEMRVREISRWTSRNKIFSFDDAAIGNRNLQVLTGGLLATRAGMDLVGNAAADAKTDMTTMSTSVGVLYASLRDGKPVADAANQLADFGVISRSTASQVISLAGSGAALSTTWGLVQNDLERSTGAMREMSKEIGALKTRLANAKEQQSQTIGESFAAGEKAGIEAQIRATEALTPALGRAAQVWGIFYTAAQKAKAAVVELVVNLPGLKGGIVAVSGALAALIGMLAVFGLVTTTQAVIALTRALVGWAAGAATAAGAAGVLARGVTMLAAATRFLLGPWGLLIGLLATAAGGLANWYIEAGNASKANEDLRNHIKETTQAMREQIAAVQTMADRTEAVRKAYQNLIDAQLELKNAREAEEQANANYNPLDDDPAAERVSTASKGVADAEEAYAAARAIATDTLAMDQDRLNMAKERLDIERQIRDEVEQATIDNLTGSQKIQALDERAARKREELSAAENEDLAQREDQKNTEQAQDALTTASQQRKASEQYFRDKGIDPAAAEKVGRGGRGGSFKTYVDAIDNEKLAQSAIDAYAQNAAKSQVFKAQNTVDQLNRPGSTATPEERQRAQLALEEARRNADVNRLRRESASADLAASQGRNDVRNQQARDLDESRAVETAGALEQLRGSGLKGEEFRQAEESIRMRDAQRRANLAREREAAIKSGDQEMIANLGAAGMTIDQARNDRSAAENDMSGIASDRALRRENADRQRRATAGENRARQLEARGNDESAERVRDAVRLEERILQLRQEGLKEEEATKQARREQRDERVSRMRDVQRVERSAFHTDGSPAAAVKAENAQRANDAINSIRVDSMASIGGNAGGGTGVTNLLRSILDELKRANGPGAMSAATRPPQWDDQPQRPMMRPGIGRR